LEAIDKWNEFISHQTFSLPVKTTGILEYYKNTFEAVYVLLHSFIKAVSIGKEFLPGHGKAKPSRTIAITVQACECLQGAGWERGLFIRARSTSYSATHLVTAAALPRVEFTIPTVPN
jgi:hypothetical protein